MTVASPLIRWWWRLTYAGAAAVALAVGWLDVVPRSHAATVDVNACVRGSESCGSWSGCSSGTQTRTCSDGCSSRTESQACTDGGGGPGPGPDPGPTPCVPGANNCTTSACSGGTQTQTCSNGCTSTTSTSSCGTQCSDGVDNDGDAKTDYPADPGCGSASDDDETDVVTPECADGLDNDSDGATDFPADTSCTDAADATEAGEAVPHCRDGTDNDGDGKTDHPADPGCASANDTDETDAIAPQCSDNLDNDNDGFTDYPADLGCVNAADNDEVNPLATECSDGADNDGDGKTDYPADPGCASLNDTAEFNAVNPACSDGTDNDGDGKTDFPADPGCLDATGGSEVDTVTVQCADGLDNDGDGAVDYPADPECSSAADNLEASSAVPLPGAPPQCRDGVDNDRDGAADFPADSGCSSADDETEADIVLPACADGLDNDGDGAVDYPADRGCSAVTDGSEEDGALVAQCSDGRDNDDDGRIDYPNDPDCSAAADGDESAAGRAAACADGLDNDGDGAVDYPADRGCSAADDGSEETVAEQVVKLDVVGAAAGVAQNVARFYDTNPAAVAVREVVLDNPVVEQATQAAVVPISTVVVTASSFSSFGLTNLLAYLQLIFTQPLALLFHGKRTRWGVVYHALTKLPVDLAVVRAYALPGDRLVRSMVTDREGRYQFLLPEGRYRLAVTKLGFTFPSKYITGSTDDAGYVDCYHGGELAVTSQTGVVNVNIPLDPVSQDVPTRRLLRQHLVRRLQQAVAFASVPIAFVAVLIVPGWYTLGMFAFNVLLYVLFKRLAAKRRPKSWGMVYDAAALRQRSPLRSAIVRIFDVQYNKLLETQVTDARGRYSFLVGKNRYYVTAEQSGFGSFRSSVIDLLQRGRELLVNFDIGLKRPAAAVAGATAPAATTSPAGVPVTTAAPPPSTPLTPSPAVAGAVVSPQPLPEPGVGREALQAELAASKPGLAIPPRVVPRSTPVTLPPWAYPPASLKLLPPPPPPRPVAVAAAAAGTTSVTPSPGSVDLSRDVFD